MPHPVSQISRIGGYATRASRLILIEPNTPVGLMYEDRSRLAVRRETAVVPLKAIFEGECFVPGQTVDAAINFVPVAS